MAHEAESIRIGDAFVDTDVIVRLIAGDDPRKLESATRLFTAVETGTLVLRCPVTVIADAIYVLTSRQLYALERALVAAALGALVDLPSFQVFQKRVVRRALDIYAETSLDFGDCMLVAEMEDSDAEVLYSFDHDFDHVSTIHRQEP